MNVALQSTTFPMMQCSKDPAGTFKSMADVSSISKATSNLEDRANWSPIISGDNEGVMRLSLSPEEHNSTSQEPNMTREISTLQSVSEDSNSSPPFVEIVSQLSPQAVKLYSKSKNAFESKDTSTGHRQTSNQHSFNDTEDKENIAMPSSTSTPDNTHGEDTSGQRSVPDASVTTSKQHSDTEVSDAEVVRRAQEEGCVNVVFPGTVTQEGCCRFVSEILKCILYQRQQLPMTYDQLVYSQRKRQASMQDKDLVSRTPVQSADMDWRKCQQTLQELEEVLQQLEVLFSLSRVPRVLLLMGGSLVLPKELYEINMEGLVLAGGDHCLRVSSCLRQLFRTLFVADLLSDSRPVHLMPTTVLVQAHRDCGIGWFRPKLQFKVPTRVKNQIIALSTDSNTCKELRAKGSDWQDYVWFQAPMTIKGFRN